MDVSRNAPRALVSAAVLVAVISLSGVMVLGVMASSAVPSQAAPGSPQADAEFEASIVVRKFLDADGSLETQGDQTSVQWEFELETDATIIDNAGGNRWTVAYDARGASVTLTEVPQEGFKLVGAFCVEPSGYSIGVLNGGSLTVQLEVIGERAAYVCEFINVRSAIDRVGGGTPPGTTLPPTDSGRSTSAPASDGRLVMAAIFAGILAASLVSVRGFGTRRPGYRKR